MNIGIFIFPDIETLDFSGPLEVFSAANLSTGVEHFHVYTFSHVYGNFKTINGLMVHPEFSLDNVPQPDVLVWPGGEGTKAVIANEGLMHKLRELYNGSQYAFSVCSGARIPAVLGLLDGQTFTTHHLVFDDILKLAPKARIQPDCRFTDNGKMLTAAGVSAGIDLSLYMIEKLKGPDLARLTAKYIEWGQTEKV